MSWTSARVAGSVLAAATATLAMAVPASADAPTPHKKNPGVGASNTVACGISYPDKDHHGWANFPANTVTLRSGPSNSCIQKGQGLHDQRADYLCYTPGDGGTWTFVRNVSTGDQGWVRDDQLPHYGSDVVCEDNPPPATVRK
jgi:hypothetical protein